MAATKHYYFRGTCKWAMVHRMDEKFNNYKIDLYPDEESMVLYKESGCQNDVKKDDDGEYITFRRKNQQLIKNELVEFGKPKVVDAEGETFSENIGNGSKVVVKIAVFPTRNGTGHRLEAVMVEDWVEYSGEEGEGSSIEQIKAEGLDDTPNF